MPHTGIHTISARQNRINKRWVTAVVLAGVRVLLQISVPFTPLSTFHFQPLPAVVTHGVDVDITFHYVTSQFSAFGRLGVARRSLALLGDIDVCKSRRSQISALLAALLAGFAALVALAGVGRRWQPQRAAAAGAGGRAMGWTTPPHHILPRSLKCSSPEHTKKKTNRIKDLL